MDVIVYGVWHKNDTMDQIILALRSEVGDILEIEKLNKKRHNFVKLS